MQFHILNENYIPIAVMDNDLPDAIHFQKSKMQRFLTGSADFFDFETSKIHIESDKFQVGYWIAFKYDDRDRLMYINDIQEAEQDKMMSISTLSSNLDLNQENTQPFSADIARPFSWYFDRIMYDTGYKIGINEISNLTRKLSWDSEMSHRAFLQSVATQFDNAELDYEVVLNSDFTVKSRLVHIKKQIGEVRDDIELRYGENIKTVKRSTNIDNLYTAIRPISKDGNDKITTIASYPDWQKLDENGNVKFFHKKGSTLIFAPQANARFGNRGINVTGGGYIVHDFSYDKVSQNELFNRSHIYLKEHSVPAINYEVEGRTGAKIGDTVKIVDDGYTPPLILSARVLEQVFSFDNASVEQATFGNYKALQSQISADLIAKMQQLADENAPYKAVTLTTNGLTFKNSEGSTTLTARLYKGSKEIVPESYEWTIDGVATSENSEQHEITADDINGKAVVRWSAVINGVMVAFDEVTITDVSDGISPTVTVNPDTSLTIIDAQGTRTTPVLKGTDGIAGKEGVGVKTTVITYAISTSGTTAPSTGWTSTVPSLVKGQYLWTKTVWTYTDNSSETGYTVSYISKDGNNGTDGIAGKDGVGISNTIIEYVGTVSGTSKPTSGWSATIPTVPAGSFLWTRTTLTYTDNTTEQVFSVAKMGNTGATGPKGDPGNQGIPGTPGVDGRTPYTHWAYANSVDGTLDFNPDYKSAVGLDVLNVINWSKNTSMSNSTYKFVSNADSSFKVTGKGTGGYEVLSKSFPAKIGDKLRFTVSYTNRLAFGLYNNYGLQFVTSEAYTESVTSTSKIVLPNVITASTEYQLEYTATTSNIWMQLNFGGVADSAQVDFDVKIEVENLTNPVKYAYMGTYSDYTAIDSTVPTDYKWSRILGEDGADGTDGIAGKDGNGIKATAITYQASTNGTTAPTGTWLASVPTVANGSFLWTRTIWTYTDNTTETGYAVAYMGTNGNNGTNGVAGKDGVGIQTTTITYAGSTSGTTAPTTGYTTAVPSVPAGQFLWTKTVWAYTDNTSETGYSVAMMGVKGERGKQIFKSSYETIPNGTGHWWSDLSPAPSIDNPPKIGDTVITPSGNILQIDTVIVGGGGGGGTFGVGGVLGNIKGPSGTDGTDGIIVSSVVPDSPQTGQLWQDTSTTPQLVKKWTGSSWVIWELYAQNLKADTLETISATIGKLNNTYTVDYGAGVHTGTVTIENGMTIVDDAGISRTITDFTSQSSGQGMFSRYLPNKSDTAKYQQAWYTPFSLRFDDTVNNWHGQITAENVTLVPWTDLILKSGFKAGDGVQPQYRRIKNLDGSYSVQFRGAVSPTSGNFQTSGNVTIGSISGVYTPPVISMAQSGDNTGKGARVAVSANGNMLILAPNSSSYVYLNQLQYIN